MVAYGGLKYDKTKKIFSFEGQCFGTSQEQIAWGF